MAIKKIDPHAGQVERSLGQKLRLLAEGGELELTAAEAAVYGADYADQRPDGDPGKEDDDER